MGTANNQQPQRCPLRKWIVGRKGEYSSSGDHFIKEYAITSLPKGTGQIALETKTTIYSNLDIVKKNFGLISEIKFMSKKKITWKS